MGKKEIQYATPVMKAVTPQVCVVDGERVGWVDQTGYLHAFTPTAWGTPYRDLIGYVDRQGQVRLWSKRVP